MRRLFAALVLALASAACRGADSDLPARYGRVAVPEERLHSGSARERGRRLFRDHCALCHGERGDGHGVRSEGFAKPPASFTDPAWRRRSSPRRVFFAIREGLRGTPMPSWASLSEGESWDLVAYVLSLGEPASPGPRPAADDPV